MAFHHLNIVFELLAGKRIVQKFTILNLLFPQTIHQLPALGIESLKWSFQTSYFGLCLWIFILFSKDKIGFQFVPGKIKNTLISFLYLLSSLELFTLREKFLEFWANIGIKKRMIHDDIEKASDNFDPPWEKSFVLANGHFWFHKGKKTVFREGWEDKSSLLSR